jgi:L-iditol 2-dehydrogenase
LTLGHESAGTVRAVGSSVTNLKVGDKVALEVGIPCGECRLCQEGRYNICKTLRFRSSAKSFPHFQGTLQDRINHPASYCHKLPERMSLEMGAILEPLGVAMHAARRAALPKDSNILIFGAGAVGLLCAAVCKASGSGNLIIADIQQDRLDFAVRNKFADASVLVPMKRCETIEDKLAFAKQVAASVTAVTAKDGSPIGEVDAVFECTGVESCLQASIYATRPGGKIMLIGMGNPIQTLPISAAALREVDLVGVFRYANTYDAAIKLIASGDPLLPDLSTMVTQRFKGLGSAPEAFDMARRVKDDSGNLVIKVLIDTSA